MKKLLLLILSAYMLAFALQSCKPNDNTPPPPKVIDTTYIPQIVKDYAWFNVGTYWVYEDSITGNLDSINVYSATTNIKAYAYGSGEVVGIFEEMTIDSKSTLDQTIYHFDLSGCPCTPDHYAHVVKYVKSTPGWGPKYSNLLTYPFVINQSVVAGSAGYATLLDTLSSYTVDGKQYNNVLLYHTTKDATMDSDTTLTWVAKGYGIIRKQSLTKNKAYWLKRANIIK